MSYLGCSSVTDSTPVLQFTPFPLLNWGGGGTGNKPRESLTVGAGGVPGSEAQSWVLSSRVWISLAASLMSLRTICLCCVMPLMLRTRRVRSLFTPGLSSHSRSCRDTINKLANHYP